LPSNPHASGSQQRGARYGVVVQADYLPLSTTLVAPTSTSAPARSFRPEIEINGTVTRVLVEQTVAINSERLGEFAGRLSSDERAAVDSAILLVLGIRR
jgi:mRNA interferase MazF